MAEEKRSFILYSDLITVVSKLVDKDRISNSNHAGELFLHILKYVNDQDPTPVDFIIEMAFEPIKQQLKRDLKKYEVIREKRAKAGRASAEKREQKLTSQTHVESVEHTSALSTVNVNDSVNVNGNVNDNDIHTIVCDNSDEKSLTPTQEKKPINPALIGFGKKPIEELKKSCAGHSTWLDNIGMKNSLSPPQVQQWFDAFCIHLVASGKEQETEQEFKRYCASWIASEVRQGRKPINQKPPGQKTKVNATDAFSKSIIKKYGTTEI
ncbi:DUF6291 domain-containing protein [Sphingobacterium corticis]|uniref:DUF6291 domain-containing protein n=1 Tax=Sphingobacterium corticis TaxID=1812823 RepID=A0ABW5NLW5_9SPHI